MKAAMVSKAQKLRQIQIEKIQSGKVEVFIRVLLRWN
jgi:hypothetical protein